MVCEKNEGKNKILQGGVFANALKRETNTSIILIGGKCTPLSKSFGGRERGGNRARTFEPPRTTPKRGE